MAAVLHVDRLNKLDQKIASGEITSSRIIKAIDKAWIHVERSDAESYMKALEEIDAMLLDPPSDYHFVQHGMKGSFAGILYYEVFIVGGSYIGWVQKYKTKWRYGIGTYGKHSPLYPSRIAAADALKAEHALRRPDRATYYADCSDRCENGCHTCWAGKK